jgi:hypothetical protein
MLPRLLRGERGIDNQPASEKLETVLANAKRLSDAVIANIDDWAEGRAYAHALRESLRKYHDEK